VRQSRHPLLLEHPELPQKGASHMVLFTSLATSQIRAIHGSPSTQVLPRWNSASCTVAPVWLNARLSLAPRSHDDVH
jgi:hypothetical protein